MKKLIYFLLLLTTVAACNDDYLLEQSNNTTNLVNKSKTNKIGLYHFKSKIDLLTYLSSQGNNFNAMLTPPTAPPDTAETGGSPVIDINTPIKEIGPETQQDPIVIYEYKHIDSTLLIYNQNLTAYEAFGYDSIVPDTAFASVLNIKGEVEVNDTIYKISPRGTYFFHHSLEEYFTNHFEEYEQQDGILIAEKTYKMDNGIFRYSTFEGENGDSQNDVLPDSLNDCSNAPYVPQADISFSDGINWDQFPTFNADAKTIVGKIWQSFFGRNYAHTHQISKKRRVKGNFYYYNYLIHSSIGISCEMQKKNWIGWSGTKADKLTITWENIIIESKYSMPSPQNYPSSVGIGKVNNSMAGIDNNIPIATVVGYDLTNYDIQKISALSGSALFNYLNSKLGSNIPPEAKGIILYGPQRVISIIPKGYIDAVNKKKIDIKFSNDWNFKITLNLTNLPTNFIGWVTSVRGTNVVSHKLIGGKIKVAVELDNTWGGMTIIKN